MKWIYDDKIYKITLTDKNICSILILWKQRELKIIIYEGVVLK